MPFKLINNGKFNLSRILMQFNSFTESEDEFPFCTINFVERPKDGLQNKKLIKKVGDHYFYQSDDNIVVANATSFVLIRNDFSQMDVYLPPNGYFVETQLAFLILQAYRYILAHNGQFQMHSAVVVHDGCGVAFCGLPGAGKSTQAHLWEEHLGAEALNLDQPCIFFEDDGVHVSGSPWSGKEDCYKNKQVPLKAIFFVEQAPENSVQKMSVAEGFSHLYLNNYLVPFNSEMEKKHQNAVIKLASNVPVYRLKCTISKEAVEVAHNIVFNNK